MLSELTVNANGDRQARSQVVAELKKLAGGIDPILESCIPKGYAYHHGIHFLYL